MEIRLRLAARKYNVGVPSAEAAAAGAGEDGNQLKVAIWGAVWGASFALFGLFFIPPAPKAAQRDPGAPPASK